jgi:hypothetical protein
LETIMTKTTTKKTAPQGETLEAARSRYQAATAKAIKLGTRARDLQAARAAERGTGNSSVMAMLTVEEAALEAAEADLSTHGAAVAYVSALLAHEAELGDEDARALVNLPEALEVKAVRIVELQKQLTEERQSLVAITNAAADAASRVEARRTAAGEPAPRKPLPMLASGILALAARARDGKPSDTSDAEREFLNALSCGPTAPPEPVGDTAAERIQSLIAGTARDEAGAKVIRARIGTIGNRCDELRLDLAALERKKAEEAREEREAEAERELEREVKKARAEAVRAENEAIEVENQKKIAAARKLTVGLPRGIA